MAAGPSRHEVVLTEGAQQDLESLHDYLCEFDSVAGAGRLLDRLLAVVGSLAQFPERGSHPRELLALGIRDYRQTHFKPWRMIYRIVDQRVVVYLIADSRRDMPSLLARRLLSATPR